MLRCVGFAFYKINDLVTGSFCLIAKSPATPLRSLLVVKVDDLATSLRLSNPPLLAEAGGFEPPMPFRACRFSRAVISTTHPHFHIFASLRWKPHQNADSAFVFAALAALVDKYEAVHIYPTHPHFHTGNDNIFLPFFQNIVILLEPLWPYRLMVRTRPFQGCNQGSIPCRVT